MRTPRLVTFLTDFGQGGEYVAACEAVMLRIDPAVRVLHLTHEVPVGDVATGARILARVTPLCPPAVHLAVVDPGVGTERRAIVLVAGRGDLLVGPDNGLLVEAANGLGGPAEVWALNHSSIHRAIHPAAGAPAASLSATFHGRDVFAPAAALLASGTSLETLATPSDAATLVRIAHPRLEMVSPGEIIAEVIEVDRFGNVGLALRFEDLLAAGEPPRGQHFQVDLPVEDLPAWEARLVRTFGDLCPGELGLYCDSWGQVALALNGASAAELLGVRRGTLVRLRMHRGSLRPELDR